jgi:hypothetical protein
MLGRMRPAALLILASLSACAGVNTPDACRITPVTELPVTMDGALPVVAVEINGHPARLVLDTGADQVLLWQGSLDRLGVERDYAHPSYAFGFGGIEANWVTRPTSMTLGTADIPPQPMLVSGVKWKPLGGEPIDGLLGSQVLSGYDVAIDIPAHRMVLYDRRRCPDGTPPIRGAEVLKAAANHAYKLNVPIVVDGVPLSAEVDTGASRSIVDMAAAGLTPAMLDQDRRVHLHTADSAGMTAWLHRFHELRVGGDVVAHPLLLVSDLHRPAYHATLGADFWRDHRVWISYGSRTVTIGPAQPRPR